MSVSSWTSDFNRTDAGQHIATRARVASFTGLLRGELRKMRGLRTMWVMVSVMVVMVVGSQILLATEPNIGKQLRDAPLEGYAQAMTGDIAIVRILSGVFLLVMAAHVIGLEHQHGTIRILLGRGVGRLQLLSAKVVALALVGLGFIGLTLLIEFLVIWGVSLVAGATSHPWMALTDEFWVDLRVLLLYTLLNAGVTLLLGVAASVLGRSLAFGLAVGLSWFAVDNALTIPLGLLARLTSNDLWRNVSGVLLGPLLNRLPEYITPAYHVTSQTSHGAIVTAHTVSGFGPMPLIWVGGAHALLIIGAWSALFAVVAVSLTARRDILD